MNITFIGNCQTVSLCFYFQQLLKQNNNICWLLYSQEVKKTYLANWSIKCKNKIMDHSESIKKIKDSDVIIYQNIDITKTAISNTSILQEIKKPSCILIQIPSIYLIYHDFDNSIKQLINREDKNNVDIKVSDIFYKYSDMNLMLTCNHPKTFLFMEIVKILCNLLELDFFTEHQYNHFLKNENYMELPDDVNTNAVVNRSHQIQRESQIQRKMLVLRNRKPRSFRISDMMR